MNKSTLFAVSSAILLSLLAPGSAHSRLTYHETIGMGGSELITLRGSNMIDIHERVGILHSRLSWILADSALSAADIQVRKTPDSMAIYAKNRLFVTVTAQDAEYNQTTIKKQARKWCEHLSETLPSLRSSERITTP